VRKVARVIQFAGTVDSDDGNPPSPAKWVSELKSVTPPDNFYGFVHTADPFWKLNKTNRNWDALGMKCESVSVDGAEPPYHDSQCLTTSVPGMTRPHTAVVSDRDTPRDENGVPKFLAVWRYLLATQE
jgi:hypothetical protein